MWKKNVILLRTRFLLCKLLNFDCFSDIYTHFICLKLLILFNIFDYILRLYWSFYPFLVNIFGPFSIITFGPFWVDILCPFWVRILFFLVGDFQNCLSQHFWNFLSGHSLIFWICTLWPILSEHFYNVDWLVGLLVLWHINLCRLFNAKSIFM